jgi:hypothetical protein
MGVDGHQGQWALNLHGRGIVPSIGTGCVVIEPSSDAAMLGIRQDGGRMPTTSRRSLALAAVALLLVAACAPASDAPVGSAAPPASPPATAAAPSGTPDAGSVPSASPGSTAEPSAGNPVVIDRRWATAELVDVATGQPFRIADLVAGGRVVFVEPMAIWCTNCRAQQADAMTALGRLDRSRVAWIGLDVDPSETAEALVAYGPRWGFDFTYALAGSEVARALVDDFGDLVISPPSTPIVVVGTDGTVTLTDYGHKSVDQIVELARAHGA